MTSTSSVRNNSVKAYRVAEGIRSGEEREAEILRHLPLVRTVVDRVAAHLPSNVDRDDLFHAGVIGLIDALNRFDASRDNAFSTYAVMRIRGQVIDELRARDWVSRGARERAKAYHLAVSELTQSLDRLPSDAELASHLQIEEGELAELEREAQLSVQVSLDAPVGEDNQLGSTLAHRDDETANPHRHMDADDRRLMVGQILASLTEQDRLVVKLYYFENLLMKEIAAIIGVTESRVCQIHSRVLAVLRTRLGSDDIFG
jgi:RNA polymerase sigma factor for flagellar operon FliA